MSTTTMRVTRGRTGKLPTPATRKGFVSDFDEDGGSPPPSPSRKASKKAENTQEEPVEDKFVDVPEVKEVVPEKKPGPVFETFKTNKTLEDGLCVVRALGGGRYEIVNLKNVDQEHFSSEEMGSVINSNDSRREALDVDEKEWDTAKFTLGQAVRSASMLFCMLQHEYHANSPSRKVDLPHSKAPFRVASHYLSFRHGRLEAPPSFQGRYSKPGISALDASLQVDVRRD